MQSCGVVVSRQIQKEFAQKPSFFPALLRLVAGAMQQGGADVSPSCHHRSHYRTSFSKSNKSYATCIFKLKESDEVEYLGEKGK